MKNIRSETRTIGKGYYFDEHGDMSLRPILLPITTVEVNNWTSKGVACSYSKACENCSEKGKCNNYGDHCYTEEEKYYLINLNRIEIKSEFLGVDVTLPEPDFNHLQIKGYNEQQELHLYDTFRELSCYIPYEVYADPNTYFVVSSENVMRWATYTKNLIMMSAHGYLSIVHFPKGTEVTNV